MATKFLSMLFLALFAVLGCEVEEEPHIPLRIEGTVLIEVDSIGSLGSPCSGDEGTYLEMRDGAPIALSDFNDLPPVTRPAKV
jgi:hypothetical protein